MNEIDLGIVKCVDKWMIKSWTFFKVYVYELNQKGGSSRAFAVYVEGSSEDVLNVAIAEYDFIHVRLNRDYIVMDCCYVV